MCIIFSKYLNITLATLYTTIIIGIYIPYKAKLSSGKTFAVVYIQIHYSLDNFCGASGSGHHKLYTASD